VLSLKKIRRTIEKNAYAESALYVAIGILLAFATYKVLGLALNTSDPIVTVMSGSMVPTLEQGDLVVVRGIALSDIKYGDVVGRQNATIIVYWQPQLDRQIIHRAWHLNEDGTIKTWGDNVLQEDPWNASAEMIKGEAVFRIPLLGWPRVLLGSLIGR